MRRTLAATILTLAALVPLVAGAQQQLGDIAGSIELNRIDDAPLVIDDENLPRAEPSATPDSTYAQTLRNVDELFEGALRNLESVLDEMTSGSVMYDQGWKTQAYQAASQLSTVGLNLTSIDPPPLFQEAHRLAMAAVEEFTAAGQQVMDATETGILPIGVRRRHIAEGRWLFREAIAHADAAERELMFEQPPPLFDGLQALQDVEQLCASRWPGVSARQEQCARQQRAAVTALDGRDFYGLGIDEAAFNRLRNRCLVEWPDDFERRDSCELQALASLDVARE